MSDLLKNHIVGFLVTLFILLPQFLFYRGGGGYVNESDRYGETLGQAVNMKSQPGAAVRLINFTSFFFFSFLFA